MTERFASWRTLCAGAVALMSFGSCQAAHSSEPATQPIPIEIGQVHVAKMTAEQPLEFILDAEPGILYLFVVEQGGFELVVDVARPGSEATTFDFPNWRDDPTHRDESELLLVDPGDGGALGFTLSTRDRNGAIAHPRVAVTPVAPSNERVPAYRLLTEAAALYAQSDWEAALGRLEQAEPLLAGTDVAALLGRCRMGIATLYYWEALDFQNGLKWFALAEQAFRAADEPLQAALARQFQGTIRVDMAYEVEKTPTAGLAPEAEQLFEEALGIFAEVLAIQEAAAAEYEAATTINLTGFAYHMRGDYDKAFEHYLEAAERYHELMAWDAEVWPVNNMGVIQFDRGYLTEAADYFTRYPETLSVFMVENLAAAYMALGELDQALTYFSQALDINQASDIVDGIGRSLQGIGDTYLAYGETELGVEYLEAALPHRRQSKDGPGLVSLLNSLGRQYLELGEFESALAAHEEALAASVDPADVAKAHLRFAEYRLATGEPRVALELLATADAIADGSGQRILAADILRLYGDAHRAAGEYQSALRSYEAALPIYEELGLSNRQARCLYGMSRSLADLGRLHEAVASVERAIDMAEGHRSSLSTPQLRSFYMAQRQNYYVHLVGALVELHRQADSAESDYLQQALAVSERSRARTLVDMINESSQLESRTGASAERDELLRQLAETRYRLQGGTAQPLTEEETIEARQRLANLENQLNLLEIQWREANPAYAELVDPTLLDADGVQAMLDGGTALLQYTLGEDFGFVSS